MSITSRLLCFHNEVVKIQKSSLFGILFLYPALMRKFSYCRSRMYTHFGGGARNLCFLVCTVPHGTMDNHLKRKISSQIRGRLLSAFPDYGSCV